MNSTGIAVSIVIPCFNDGKFLPEAVGSAEPCQSSGCEIIVVNDGSTDQNTLEVLATIEQRGHRVLHQQNRGLGGARNAGISIARGRYILPLDSDNRVRPAYPVQGAKILDCDPAIDVVYGDPEYFGGKTCRNHVADFDLQRLLSWNYIDACAVFRKSAWERCGGYDEKMPSMGYEDWDLWCRIALSGGGFCHVDEVLYDYRVRPDSMSSGMGDQDRVAAIQRHLRAKRMETTIGNYVDALQSSDFAVAQLRARPVKNLIGLLTRTYFPGAYSRWQTRRRQS